MTYPVVWSCSVCGHIADHGGAGDCSRCGVCSRKAVQQPAFASEVERVMAVLAEHPSITKVQRHKHDGGIVLYVGLISYATLTISLDWDEVDDVARITRLHLERAGLEVPSAL